MDNGSNVCGIEFNYDNKGEGGQGDGEEENGGGGGQGDGEDEDGEGEDDPESLIGAVNNQIMGKLFPGFGVKSEALIRRKLFLGFQVKSEVGRSVFQCKDVIS